MFLKPKKKEEERGRREERERKKERKKEMKRKEGRKGRKNSTYGFINFHIQIISGHISPWNQWYAHTHTHTRTVFKN